MRVRAKETQGSQSPVSVPLWWSALPAGVALCLYLVLAPHVSGDKDASEFTLVLALNGVAHPTGYPLYTLFGHQFVRLVHALGATWSYAANAWSAVGGAVAVFFVHALAVRLVPGTSLLSRRGRFLAAQLPLAVFALDPMWTFEATLAEVYSWHLAWVGATCMLFVDWMRVLEAGGRSRQQIRHAARLWGLLVGAGLAHHLTSALVSAPLTAALVWSLWRERRLESGAVLQALLAAALPLSSYGIVAYRAFHPTVVQWPVLGASWSEVFAHVTGAQYHSYLWQYRPSAEQRVFLARYVYPFLGVGLAALVSAAVSAARERLARWTLACTALAATASCFVYGAQDPSSYFVTPMALGVPGVAAVLATAARPAWLRRHLVAVTTLVGLGVVAALLPWVRVAQDRRRVYEQFELLVHGMWASIPFDTAIVLWGDDMYARLLEYQKLRGEKPAIDVQNPYGLAFPRVRERFIARHGFDPLGDVSLKVGLDGRLRGGERALETYVADLERHLNQRSPLPVIVFDPKQRSVRLLNKPAAGPGASAAGEAPKP